MCGKPRTLLPALVFTFYPHPMPTRSRSPKKRRDEQQFPIRIRFRVPEMGFGRQYDEIHEWLLQHAGREGYAWNSDCLPGVDAFSVYLRDPELVKPFIEAFGLETAEYA